MESEPTEINTPTFSAYLKVSKAYTVKVVTDNGFVAEGTYYSPSALE
ncbi:MAG: hypothetical protein ACE5Z5_01025 [Candidatus Bathyarchaeia archaeon]